MRDCKIYAFLWLVGFPADIGKELFTYFIRVDGSPKWSLAVALSGGIGNIILDYIFVEKMEMGILGAGLATVVFNRTALKLAGESGIAVFSLIMYLQFIFIGIYFGYSMGISPLLSYAYGKGERIIVRFLKKNI